MNYQIVDTLVAARKLMIDVGNMCSSVAVFLSPGNQFVTFLHEATIRLRQENEKRKAEIKADEMDRMGI